MSGGYTGVRAAASTVSSQGTFTGQFDSNMNNLRLIGGKTKLQQFDDFQSVLANTTSKYCGNLPEDVITLMHELEGVVIDKPEMLDECLMERKQGHMHISN